MRPAHWAKNVLLAVPAVLGQVAFTPDLASRLAIGFVAACACASAGYFLNDALDRGADRIHPVKRLRPVASGALAVNAALGLATALATGGLALAWLLLGAAVAALLVLYLALSALYSLFIKRLLAADVLMLAGLYMLRLEIGAEIAGVAASWWLLAFGFTFFVALALLKRLDELATLSDPAAGLPRRAYGGAHAEWVRRAAAAAGVAAMALLASYVLAAARHYYGAPAWLWLAVGLVGVWLAWILRHARLGRLRADPVAFAITDRLSLALGGGVLAALLLAR